MNTFRTVGEIKDLTGRVFVRWSKSLDLDNARGYSLRHGTQAEAGISVCSIDQSWPEWRILRQIQEYAFLGGECWIVTGAVVGNGGDEEPLLAGMLLLGKVSIKLVNADWLKMWRDAEIERQTEILANLTDSTGIEITKRFISRLQSNDRNIWRRANTEA